MRTTSELQNWCYLVAWWGMGMVTGGPEVPLTATGNML